jgi:uncharacterized membrane protein/HAMP domain-containing protein
MKAGQRFLLSTLIGVVAYGVLNALSNAVLLPTAPFISLRPQVVLPMGLGMLVGPWCGFIAGCMGNLMGDSLSGYGVLRFWNWHIASGLMGLVPGLVKYLDVKEVRTIREFGIVEASVIAACAAAIGFAVTTDVIFVHLMSFPRSWHAWILPAFLTDAVNGFILVPIILLFARRIVMTIEIRTILMITGLLVVAVFVTCVPIIWSVWDDLITKQGTAFTFYFAGMISLLVIATGFCVSIWLSRRITDPVVKLTRAVEAVEEGNYDLPGLDDVSERADEFGRLSRVFRRMAAEVDGREKRLKQKVADLRIEIDRARQAKDVAEIVETDYFQDLRRKAKKFREK